MGYVLGKDEEISLIMPEWHEGEEEYFEITMNDTLDVVGLIRFYHEVNPSTGNVEYKVFEECCGNNYAKKALKILAKNVFKLDEEDLYIAILPDNYASIKTAIGAGAVFEQKVKIPKNYIFSQDGKYKYANMYVIKNDGGIKNEEDKSKKHL